MEIWIFTYSLPPPAAPNTQIKPFFMFAGFVVGQAGLYQSIVMFLVAYLIVTMTVLSICAISTNGALEAGGAYRILYMSPKHKKTPHPDIKILSDSLIELSRYDQSCSGARVWWKHWRYVFLCQHMLQCSLHFGSGRSHRFSLWDSRY